MKKIKLINWTEEFVTEGKTETKEANIKNLLNFLLNHHDPRKNLLKGMDNFRALGRIRKVLDSDKKDFLEFENSDYLLLRKLVEEEIPAGFSDIQGLPEAVEEFLNPGE
jgi:hypothetical protein